MAEVPTQTGTAGRAPVAALLLAIAGAGLMVWGFLAGIDAALNAAGSGAGPFLVIFFIGAALVLVALFLAVRGLLTRKSVGLSWATLVIALLPVIGSIILWVTNLLAR